MKEEEETEPEIWTLLDAEHLEQVLKKFFKKYFSF